MAWLLIKRGLYWRPDSAGYTGLRREAGRYDARESEARLNDGVTRIPEVDAPEFAPSCCMEVKMRELQRQNDELRTTKGALKFVEDRVLEAMNNHECFMGEPLESCWTFNYLVRETGLPRELIRGLCRKLTDEGFARYANGLCTEDGETAGAGYGITQKGIDRLNL